MADQDEWRLGDEDSGGVCTVCGHRGRADLERCAACGAPLLDDGDFSSLRTIGEAMGGNRPSRRSSRRRERAWVWRLVLLAFAAVLVVGYWISRPPTRHLVLDDTALAPRGGMRASPAASVTPAVHAHAPPPPAAVPVAAPPPARAPAPVAPAAPAATAAQVRVVPSARRRSTAARRSHRHLIPAERTTAAWIETA